MRHPLEASLLLFLIALPAAGAEVDIAVISGFPFAPGDAANGDSLPRQRSADGRYVLLNTLATNLEAGIADANSATDVYVFDRQSGLFDLVSRSAAFPSRTVFDERDEANGIAISDDGRWAYFESKARGLVSGVTYTAPFGIYANQVYLFDRVARTTQLVSHAPGLAATAGDHNSEGIGMSADGRWLLFQSVADNLAPGGASPFRHIFLFDRSTGDTSLVSHAAGAPAYADDNSAALEISADGRYVLLESEATNLAAGLTDSANTVDIFVYDRQTDSFELISRAAASPTTAIGGIARDLSPDGRFVLLDNQGVALVAGHADGTGNDYDSFVFDRQTGTAQLASRSFSTATTSASGESFGYRLSDDGRYIYFLSIADNLIPSFVGNNAGGADLFYFDRQTATVTLASHAAGNPSAGANADMQVSRLPRALSPDGRFLLMSTSATNLEAGVTDSNGVRDLYVFDRDSSSSRLASRLGDTPVAGSSHELSELSGLLETDGSVLFASQGALDPAAPDPFITQDLFRFDAGATAVSLISSTPLTGKTTWPRDSHVLVTPMLSNNGRWASWGAYLWDGGTGALELFGHAAGAPAQPANGHTFGGLASPDGRFVAYATYATDVAAGIADTNNDSDVFLYDRNVDTAVLLSHAAGAPAIAGDDHSLLAWSADDVGYFVFESRANDLIAGMSGATHRQNVYFYDRQAGAAQLVSHGHASLSESGDDDSSFRQIAGNRSWLVYSSGASNLVPGFVDHNNSISEHLGEALGGDSGQGVSAPDLYFYDRNLHQATLITRRPGAGNEGSAGVATGPRATADGLSVFFTSGADDLVAGQTPAADQQKVYRWSRGAGTVELVVPQAGQPAVPCSGSTELADITPDGRFVLFHGTCALVPGDTNGTSDAYLLDRQNGQFRLVSHLPGLPGLPSGHPTVGSDISDDGRRIVYFEDDFYPFTYDRQSETATRLSFASYDPAEKVPLHLTFRIRTRASSDGTRILLGGDDARPFPFDGNELEDFFLATLSGLFADGFEAGNTDAWSQTLP